LSNVQVCRLDISHEAPLAFKVVNQSLFQSNRNRWTRNDYRKSTCFIWSRNQSRQVLLR